MNLQKLISVLTEQELNLKKLIEIISDKKECLVNNNYEKLNEIIAKEEHCLLSIQIMEESRLEIMQHLFTEFNIDNKRYKLEILVNGLNGIIDPKILDQISQSEKRIKNSIEEINRINHLNLVLIQQSRNLINDTIKAVINTSKRSILDRKA
jgi:hypothetical protein